jgi:hypothetical protein
VGLDPRGPATEVTGAVPYVVYLAPALLVATSARIAALEAAYRSRPSRCPYFPPEGGPAAEVSEARAANIAASQQDPCRA